MNIRFSLVSSLASYARVSSLLSLVLPVALLFVAACAGRPPYHEESAACASQGDVSSNAGRAVAPRPPQSKKLMLPQRLQADFAAAKKTAAGYNYTKGVALWREIRERPEYATNAVARLQVANEIVKLCRVPAWTSLRFWDAALEAEIPVECQAILADSAYSCSDKLPFLSYLVCWQVGEANDAKLAKKTLDDFRAANSNLKPGEAAALDMAYASYYRWIDDFENAWAAVERAAAAGDKRKAPSFARQLARETGAWDRAVKLCVACQGEYEFLCNPPCGPDARKMAEAYVRNEKNKPAQRATIVARYFTGKDALDRELRGTVKPEDLAKYWDYYAWGPIVTAYQYADYAHMLELWDFFGSIPAIARPNASRARLRLVALGAVGRREDAAKLAAERAADEKAAPMDKAKFLVLQALLTGGDIAKVIADSGFTGLQAAELWRTASRQALAWGDSATAEKCAAAHEACFGKIPKRRLKVVYSEDPIESAADWRHLRDRLDCQACDLKYGLTLEDMVTDVASGREEIKASAFDNDMLRANVSAACDRNGLHLFISVDDPSAEAVRDGFSGGLGTEVFFAPGADAPYTYFYTSPTEGVKFLFHTMYDNAFATRPDDKHRKAGMFLSDSSFSKSNYVSHIFMRWDTFAARMPVDGTVWKIDCLARSAKGQHTWAGSQGPHHRSNWGDLVFALTPEQLTEIRRAALYRAKKTWRTKGRLDVFDAWRDWSIGDPKFYAEVLKPIETELADGMKDVKPDMTDEDVNRVFDTVFVRASGLKHEIDRLRRDWLRRQMTE